MAISAPRPKTELVYPSRSLGGDVVDSDEHEGDEDDEPDQGRVLNVGVTALFLQGTHGLIVRHTGLATSHPNSGVRPPRTVGDEKIGNDRGEPSRVAAETDGRQKWGENLPKAWGVTGPAHPKKRDAY